MAILAIGLSVQASAQSIDHASKTPPHTESPTSSRGVDGEVDDHAASAFGEEARDQRSSGDDRRPPDSISSPDGDNAAAQGDGKGVEISNPPKDVKVEVRTEGCTDMSVDQCASSRAGCRTANGGAGYEPPTITWVRVDGGDWQYSGLSCGAPTSVTLPESDEEVEVEAPPVPTLAQIQRAFRSLPFSQPSVKIQPKGQRTAKNLKTFYAAEWPDDTGLQPGEVSKPVKLLSWSIEFRVAAKDYRYNYGDDENSGWVASKGGTYPDGDVTHTYSETGDVEVSVDARLTGQYRVNGGGWQDIATVADLQDEPSYTLEVRGTKTGLVYK